MDKLIEEIVQLYFLGGNLQEVLSSFRIKPKAATKAKRQETKFSNPYMEKTCNQMFSNW